jgi:hypothetical protein
MRLVGTYVYRIEGCDFVSTGSNPHDSAPRHRDDDMGVPMALEAGKSFRFEFKVAHMKGDFFAMRASQNLTRSPAILAAAFGSDFVGFDFYPTPPEP